MENVALMQLVDEVRDLPLTVSDVLAQVIQECDNADASVAGLAQIMARDQALAAMVLKLANSAYYGYARKIESLPDAVVLLGFASVKNLAITASITRLLASGTDDLAPIRVAIFDHCLGAAVASRILGRAHRVSGEKAFVAGLLHDLGMIVLVCYRKDRFRQLLALQEERGCELEDCEEEVFGFSSAELGTLVAAEWKFPPALCEALRYQRTPELAVIDPMLASVVHCADWVVKHAGIGLVPPSVPPLESVALAPKLGLTELSLTKLGADVRAEFLASDSLRAA